MASERTKYSGMDMASESLSSLRGGLNACRLSDVETQSVFMTFPLWCVLFDVFLHRGSSLRGGLIACRLSDVETRSVFMTFPFCCAFTMMQMGSLQDSSDGKVYQIEVPALLSQNEYLANSKNPFELEFGPGASCDSNGISCKKGILKHKISAKPHSDSGNEDVLVEQESGLESGESSIQGSKQKGKHLRNQGYGDEENFLVPGFCDDSWREIDEASFLLGLYIFGKNFVPVKKFVGNKKMGAILSFYYGIFYKSKEYQRWKDCRKMRIRRCVHGQKIFTGLRLQELLSRLYPQVLEECQQTLLEVSKSYVDGKMVLDEYVFALKAIVGTNSLVEAVAIGRGKLDLTGNVIEPSKSNQNVHQIPGNKERTPIQDTDCLKVTVVDTSSADGELFKVRQFCPLPSEVPKITLSVSSSSSEESNDEKPELLTTALRRQSTRNWIPTPRALEALANGYLTSSTRKKKDKENESIFYDTNIPQLSPDMETGASLMGGRSRDIPVAAKPSTELVSSEKQENTASPRQSTRNRSPTARVLEAVANGYLTTNTRKKKYCQRSRFGKSEFSKETLLKSEDHICDFRACSCCSFCSPSDRRCI